MAKQTLDLYELFRLVVTKGGLVEVINKKLWREITKGLNLPSSITSAAFTLRTQYMKYLYPYECEKLKLSCISELQSAIDGNRREGRRPGYGYDFSPISTVMNTPPTPHLNGGGSGAGMYTFNNGRLSTALTPKDEDHPLLTSSAHSMMTSSSQAQLRNLQSEHVDTRTIEAATRAMDEVNKRILEASRAAMAASVFQAAVGPDGGLVGRGINMGGGAGVSGGGGDRGIFEADTSPSLSCSRPVFNDERFGITHTAPGMHNTHIKLSTRSNGRLEYDGSMVISMEINGMTYQGVLFAQHPIRI